MSDLVNAAKASKSIREQMKQAEKLAMPGTHEHWQICSAMLMSQWYRIVFCLEVLEKQAGD